MIADGNSAGRAVNASASRNCTTEKLMKDVAIVNAKYRATTSALCVNETSGLAPGRLFSDIRDLSIQNVPSCWRIQQSVVRRRYNDGEYHLMAVDVPRLRGYSFGERFAFIVIDHLISQDIRHDVFGIVIKDFLLLITHDM